MWWHTLLCCHGDTASSGQAHSGDQQDWAWRERHWEDDLVAHRPADNMAELLHRRRVSEFKEWATLRVSEQTTWLHCESVSYTTVGSTVKCTNQARNGYKHCHHTRDCLYCWSSINCVLGFFNIYKSVDNYTVGFMASFRSIIYVCCWCLLVCCRHLSSRVQVGSPVAMRLLVAPAIIHDGKPTRPLLLSKRAVHIS